ncbi:nuclear transport factor 2 family protein [Streptomyces gobitricini]|uniref:SnoaL-like domain-containing protein n=1 Tax=Streptomyces gobitricini TaxID=68211 RepID=A0ABP5YWC2_9ACTN
MEPPEQFIADFFSSFTEQALRNDEDPGHVVDRYFTADIVQVSDGVRLDRDKLVAHIRPLRKNLVAYRFDVHEALMDGGRVAARLTVHGRMRKGREIATEVHLFGEFTPEGRMRLSHQLTRTLPEGR